MASSIPVSASVDLVAATAAAPTRERRRTERFVVAGGAFVLVLAVMAMAAPWLAPQDPERTSLRVRLVAPTLEATDGRAHVFGTDHLGRDVLSRLIYGPPGSPPAGLAAAPAGGPVGPAAGIRPRRRG